MDGLRRSEAAALAGARVEHFTGFERRVIGGASPRMLDSIAKALSR
ncbi:hypothetical protein ACFVWF_28330 [Rhodococcus qingshengii]